MDIKARKFYIRYREQHPETEVLYSAWLGMDKLNVETVPFYWPDDIDKVEDLGPEVGVAGWLGDVWNGLRKLGKPIPPPLDYPEELREFLGRNVRQATLGEVRNMVEPIFVKPQEHKAFTGFVWRADRESRMRVVTQTDEMPVWVSDPVEFVVEYRAFQLYETIIDCRKYKGDWGVAPDRKVVEAAWKQYKKVAPAACCLDWGVTADGRTLLVEANDGMSFGGYGLPVVSHARMLAARWHELAS
jgi:hypothetical protein